MKLTKQMLSIFDVRDSITDKTALDLLSKYYVKYGYLELYTTVNGFITYVKKTLKNKED